MPRGLRTAAALALVTVAAAACGSTASGTGGNRPTPTPPGGNPVEPTADCLAACGRFGGVCAARCDEACATSECASIPRAEQLVALQCRSGDARTNASISFRYADETNGQCTLPSIVEPDARPPRGAALTAKRVFRTSLTYSGALAKAGGQPGAAGADKICSDVAASASLGGAWKAWMSDSTADAVDRIAGEGPWYSLGRGAILFPNRASLATQPTVVFGDELRDELGRGRDSGSWAEVWTGTGAGGKRAANTCEDWSNETAAFKGEVVTTTFPAAWSSPSSERCDTKKGLICFEQ